MEENWTAITSKENYIYIYVCVCVCVQRYDTVIFKKSVMNMETSLCNKVSDQIKFRESI
jgi:hypothetical protein